MLFMIDISIDPVYYSCMETHKPTKFTINYEEEDLKEYYTRQWVWKWVEQFHPEAFTKAREFVDTNWGKINVENTGG